MPTRKSPTGRPAGRGSGKRERISPKGDTRYVKRSAAGRFKESDDAGRAARVDRTRRAKAKVRSGYGDRGDRARGR